MGAKKPWTPRSRIKAAIRQLWLRSRERAKVLKEANYSCSQCNIKQSRTKGKEVYVEVHHTAGIDIWKEVIDLIAKNILESEQICLCKQCHKDLHIKLKKEEKNEPET